jgi:hypothetical protein
MNIRLVGKMGGPGVNDDKPYSLPERNLYLEVAGAMP